MAFDNRGGGNGSIAQINVTPLVDVMLVLLVIFMVTAPIIQQGVSVDLPKTRAAGLNSQEDPLVVGLTKDGTIYLNDNQIALAICAGSWRRSVGRARIVPCCCGPIAASRTATSSASSPPSKRRASASSAW